MGRPLRAEMTRPLGERMKGSPWVGMSWVNTNATAELRDPRFQQTRPPTTLQRGAKWSFELRASHSLSENHILRGTSHSPVVTVQFVLLGELNPPAAPSKIYNCPRFLAHKLPLSIPVGIHEGFDSGPHAQDRNERGSASPHAETASWQVHNQVLGCPCSPVLPLPMEN